ncbi:glycosyltransferase family 2 protein [bacterium]|nr:glycosyltransferase family 2 protein [bacterium]MCP5462625.1 glycosyltransferase family 2 protein [bacterium]
MDISIIIINWNTESLLRMCLEHIAKTIKGYEFEVIVIDNGSKDQSVAMVKSEFSKVILIENSENRGFARAVNQGIRIAKGSFIVLLNSDARLEPNAIDVLVTYMNNNPDAGVCGGQLYHENLQRQHSFDNYPTLLSELTNKSILRMLFPKRYPSKKVIFTMPQNVESIIGACMMVRRKCIDSAGMLDEDFFFFMEETEWCLRIRKAGYRIVYHPDAKIIHLQGKSANKQPIKSRLEYYNSRYIFFKKVYSVFSFTVLYSVLFVRCIMEAFFYSLACLFTLCRWEKIVYKCRLAFFLVAAHLNGFPKSMRIEGQNEIKRK